MQMTLWKIREAVRCSANDSGASSWHGKAFQVQRIPSELDFRQHSIIWSRRIYIDPHSEVLFAGKAEKILIFFPIFRCNSLNYRVLKFARRGHGSVSLWIFRSRGSGRLWHLQVQLQGHKSSQQLCHAPVLEPSRQGDYSDVSQQAFIQVFSWTILSSALSGSLPICSLWLDLSAASATGVFWRSQIMTSGDF